LSGRVVVCADRELAPGCMAAARIELLPVMVVRTGDGSLHGFVDRCLHQAARLSGGTLSGEVLRCPWHGYEYDVRSGCALVDPRLRLRRVRVEVEDEMIVAYAG
jgi:nitrite reductase/ring-hydroxylating ferredoxin subunit